MKGAKKNQQLGIDINKKGVWWWWCISTMFVACNLEDFAYMLLRNNEWNANSEMCIKIMCFFFWGCFLVEYMNYLVDQMKIIVWIVLYKENFIWK